LRWTLNVGKLDCVTAYFSRMYNLFSKLCIWCETSGS